MAISGLMWPFGNVNENGLFAPTANSTALPAISTSAVSSGVMRATRFGGAGSSAVCTTVFNAGRTSESLLETSAGVSASMTIPATEPSRSFATAMFSSGGSVTWRNGVSARNATGPPALSGRTSWSL